MRGKENKRDAPLSTMPVHTWYPEWTDSHWTPQFACKECHRQCVETPTKPRISEETNRLIDKLLLERLRFAGIVRVTRVSARWLQDDVIVTYAAVPRHVAIPAQKTTRAH